MSHIHLSPVQLQVPPSLQLGLGALCSKSVLWTPESKKMKIMNIFSLVFVFCIPNLQSACHSEGVRARSLQLEQTLEAVARSVGERRERMLRLTGAGSRYRGSEQPAGHR